MSTLTQQQKLFVVRKLGHRHSLRDVCELVEEEFGVTTTTSQIARYNVGCEAAETLSDDLVAEYNKARAEFDAEQVSIPITNKSYRLRELQKLYEQTRKTSPIAAARLLELAAKEAGGHKQEIETRGRGPGTREEGTRDRGPGIREQRCSIASRFYISKNTCSTHPHLTCPLSLVPFPFLTV